MSEQASPASSWRLLSAFASAQRRLPLDLLRHPGWWWWWVAAPAQELLRPSRQPLWPVRLPQAPEPVRATRWRGLHHPTQAVGHPKPPLSELLSAQPAQPSPRLLLVAAVLLPPQPCPRLLQPLAALLPRSPSLARLRGSFSPVNLRRKQWRVSATRVRISRPRSLSLARSLQAGPRLRLSRCIGPSVPVASTRGQSAHPNPWRRNLFRRIGPRPARPHSRSIRSPSLCCG